MAELDLQDLRDRYRLSADAADRLAILAEILRDDPHAPISTRAPARVWEEHLADSLTGLELSLVRDAGMVLDVGSGAGLPALPLAIALPSALITALDANSRKADWVSRAITRCGLSNARSVAARVEEFADGLSAFDVVTARALAPLAVVVEYAAPLLRMGGALVAWRGRRDTVVEQAASAAAAALGMEPAEVVHVIPFSGATDRHLHVMRKVAPTPERFPRRVGLARKRPLGAGV